MPNCRLTCAVQVHAANVFGLVWVFVFPFTPTQCLCWQWVDGGGSTVNALGCWLEGWRLFEPWWCQSLVGPRPRPLTVPARLTEKKLHMSSIWDDSKRVQLRFINYNTHMHLSVSWPLSGTGFFPCEMCVWAFFFPFRGISPNSLKRFPRGSRPSYGPQQCSLYGSAFGAVTPGNVIRNFLLALWDCICERLVEFLTRSYSTSNVLRLN